MAALFQSDQLPTSLKDLQQLPTLFQALPTKKVGPLSRSPGSMSLQTDGTTRKISDGPCNDAYTASLKCEGAARVQTRACWLLLAPWLA